MIPYLLLLLLIVAIAVMSGLQSRPWRTGGVIAAVLLMLFAGFRSNGPDYFDYLQMVDAMSASAGIIDWPARLLIGKDPLFGVLVLAIASAGVSAQWLIMSSAILSVGAKWRAFQHTFGGAAAGLLASLGTYYFLHDFTQVRVAIAIGLCFLSLIALHEKRRGASIGWGLLATGFHASAVLYLLLAWTTVLEARRGRWMLAGLVVIVLAIARAASAIIAEVDERTALQLEEAGTSLTPILVASVHLAALAWLYRESRSRWPEIPGLLRACMMLCTAALPMLIGFRTLSTAAAFRFYELLDAFSVFILVAAFVRGTAPMKLVVVALCAISLAIAFRSGVLPDYSLASF
jgi:hypothetical protein